MNTNNPYANITDLGGPRVCEPCPVIGREPDPISTELCSERLGADLIYFLSELERIFRGSLRDQAKSLRERICLAGIRERKS